jgi:hypothetical protein
MNSYIYVDLKNPTKLEELSSFFMINCLLRARISLHLESNKTIFDEDVNIYIAKLLDNYIHSSYLAPLEKIVSVYDMDVANFIEDKTNTRDKYEIYKANADNLLIQLGVFEQIGNEQIDFKPFYFIGKESYINRAKIYYSIASSLASRLYGKNSGISEVLEKLGNDFEKYLTLIFYLKKEYFNFLHQLSKGEMYHLEKCVSAIGKKDLINQKRNIFLDLYSEWLKSRDPDLKDQIESVAAELEKIDPEFRFNGFR